MQREAVAKAVEAEQKSRSPTSPGTNRRADTSLHPVLQLQRLAGNRAVGRFLQAKLRVNQPGDAYEQDADRVADQVMRAPAAPVDVAPVRPVVQRKCAACEEEEERLQTKLTIGQPGDAYEQEADRIADQVMCAPAGPAEAVRVGPLLQRKCAACDDEEARLRARHDRSFIPGSGKSQVAPPIVHDVMRSPGQPLDQEARAFFEPRFGRDFSRVSIHADSTAAQAAERIDARAFTLGHDIVFARGEYAPGTREGRGLIAHELAHVMQQAPLVARQAAPYYTRTFQERGGGGQTDFTETVQVAPTRTGTIIQGSVDRSEVVPAAGSQPQQQVSSGQVKNIRFDTSNCTLTLPYKFNFRQQPTAPSPFCQEPPSATAVQPVPAARFQQIQNDYVAAVNAGLNDWYKIKIEGCKHPCAGKLIPITIAASIDPSSPDKVIDVVNRSGRGNAGTICAGSFSSSFATHEGGHQILGLGDEYREIDAVLRQRVPQWARDERVRTDLTYMGSETDYGRFSLFHERHFRFAQVFVEAALLGQGCSVQLDAVSRKPVDFRIDVSLGYASRPGRSEYGTFGAYLGVGRPLDRLRRFEVLVGGQGEYFLAISPQDRNALLLGARVGFEARSSVSGFSVTGEVFGTGGALHQFEKAPEYGRPGLPATTGGFLEGGLSVGITGSGPSPRLAIEAARGQEFRDDPNAMKWYRIGLVFGGKL